MASLHPSWNSVKAATLMLTLAACPTTGTTGGETCVAGEAKACDCPSGGQGTQLCRADGTSYGSCTGCLTGASSTSSSASGSASASNTGTSSGTSASSSSSGSTSTSSSSSSSASSSGVADAGPPDGGGEAAFPPVTNFTVTSADDGDALDLAWTNPAPGPPFDHVKVLRKLGGYPVSSEDAQATVVYQGAAELFTDGPLNNGTEYFYSAYAQSNGGQEGPAAHANGTPQDTLGPDDVAGLTVVDAMTDGVVALDWTLPLTPSDRAGIVIVRKLGSAPADLADGTELVRLGADALGYDDTTAADGEESFYLVATFDEIPNYSLGVTDSATPTDQTAPPAAGAPTLTANDDGSISVAWTTAVGGDLVGTRVVRKIGSAPADPTDGTVVYDGLDSSVVDSDVTPATRYHYAAYAYDDVPNYAVGVAADEITRTGVVTNVALYAESSDDWPEGIVHLSWDNPTDAEFYGARVVHNATAIPTSPTDGRTVCDVAGVESCMDSIATAGADNFYAVFAHNSANRFALGVGGSTRVTCGPVHLDYCGGVTPDGVDRTVVTGGGPLGIAGLVTVGMTRGDVVANSGGEQERSADSTDGGFVPRALKVYYCEKSIAVSYRDIPNGNGELSNILDDADVVTRISSLRGFAGHTDTGLRIGDVRSSVTAIYGTAAADYAAGGIPELDEGADLYPRLGMAYGYSDAGVAEIAVHNLHTGSASPTPVNLTLDLVLLKLGTITASFFAGTSFSTVKGILGTPDTEGFGNLGTSEFAVLDYGSLGIRVAGLRAGNDINTQQTQQMYITAPFAGRDGTRSIGLGSTKTEWDTAFPVNAVETAQGSTVVKYTVKDNSFGPDNIIGVAFTYDETCTPRAVVMIFNYLTL